MRIPLLNLTAVAGLVLISVLGWNMTARAAYETAQYEVIEKDGNIEIRQYPDLMLASVDTGEGSQKRDGSFMKLFRYISGANIAEQKIAMTTPVFMEDEQARSPGKMGFVLPQDVAAAGIPAPEATDVTIRKRCGGRFAVIRFAGKLNSVMAREKEAELRKWLDAKGIAGEEFAESAGYDAPFTPGPLRRNEVLIRLKEKNAASGSASIPEEDK